MFGFARRRLFAYHLGGEVSDRMPGKPRDPPRELGFVAKGNAGSACPRSNLSSLAITAPPVLSVMRKEEHLLKSGLCVAACWSATDVEPPERVPLI